MHRVYEATTHLEILIECIFHYANSVYPSCITLNTPPSSDGENKTFTCGTIRLLIRADEKGKNVTFFFLRIIATTTLRLKCKTWQRRMDVLMRSCISNATFRAMPIIHNARTTAEEVFLFGEYVPLF